MRYFSFTSLIVSLLFIASKNVNALTLQHIKTHSVADANWCGDLNSIVVYKIINMDKDDLSYDYFTPNSKNIKTIVDLVNEQYDFEESMGYSVILQHDKSIDLLVKELGLKRNNEDKFYLTSCHQISSLKDFNLKISGRKLALIEENDKKHYLTIGLGTNFDYSIYQIHVFIDLEQKKLALFYNW